MSEQYCMTKMAWEQRYLDDSGVEYAVRYDGDDETTEGVGSVSFQQGFVDSASFPQSKIDWLIYCLQQIKQEQGL